MVNDHEKWDMMKDGKDFSAQKLLRVKDRKSYCV